LKGISKGQSVAPGMLENAKKLRRQMTPEEQLLWRALRGNRLNGIHFRRQQIIGGYIVDFFCEAADLVIEVDGEFHSDTKAQDKIRDAELGKRGICVLRFENHELRHGLENVSRRIADRTRIRTAASGSPSRTGRG